MGDPAASPPASGKRRRCGEDACLKRVAEIVMVLAAAGEMRGGREPTAAERALAAEARERLAAAVGEGAVRPKDLFPREAVCAVVEDLGLNRAKDPAAMGFRPPKASIAERLLLTKRKMEEVKEAAIHPTTYVPQTTVSSVAVGFQDLHGAPTVTVGGVPRNPSAVTALPATTPITSASPVVLKQPRLNEQPAGSSSLKPSAIPSVVALPHTGPPHLKLDKGVNGPPNLAQSGATIGQSNKSLHDTAARFNLNAVQSSNQVVKNQGTKVPAIQAVTGNLAMGHQAQPGVALPHPKSIFANHNGIAKNVQQILHQPANHPSWTPPSTEYMHAGLDCQICKVAIMDVDSLLVCDACEKGAHLKCLQHYGNKGVPKAEWHCPTCLAQSKGKPLPPKYGKVTRTVVAPKAVLPGGATQLSAQRAAENVATDENYQKVAVNGNLIKPSSTEAGSTIHNIGVLALNASAGSKPQSVSASGPPKENVNHAENSFNQKEENGPPCNSMVSHTVKSPDEFQSSELATGSSTGIQSEKSPNETENSGLPSCSLNSANDSMQQSTATSGVKCSDHSFGVAAEVKHQSGAHSEPHPSRDMEMTDNIGTPMDRSIDATAKEKHQSEAASEFHMNAIKDVELITDTGTPTDRRHEANGATENWIKEPANKGAFEGKTGSTRQVTSNGVLCTKAEVLGRPEVEAVGQVTAPGVVDWVGDALKVVDGKAYYSSCNIDGLIYKLQDCVLIVSKDRKFAPSKLQSLWEEYDSGSKMAMVELYCFASDIPESISQACDAEENEVYASNSQQTIMVSAICGPCEVLQVAKYREETKRRSQVDADSKLHPIFFCRWKYDEPTSSFSSISG